MSYFDREQQIKILVEEQEMDRDRELDEVVHKLIGLTAINKDFSWGSFLLSSIHKCADDETLDKMIADIKEYVNKVEANPQLLG